MGKLFKINKHSAYTYSELNSMQRSQKYSIERCMIPNDNEDIETMPRYPYEKG